MVEPDNIVLTMLRRMDEKLDRVADDLHDIKVRVTALEEGQAKLLLAVAGTNRRIDGIELRLDRIERRLNLTETSQ
jgi:hypothetical protein